MITFKSFLSTHQHVKQLVERYSDDDQDQDFDLDHEDRWLKKYTYEAIDKFPSPEDVAALQAKYPYEGGTIYRGINFTDQKQYERFLEETNDGTILKTGSITSWTRGKGTAYQFSVTRPTYFLNRELMQAEDKKNKDRDFMIGHAGVIIQLTLKAGIGIDVNKSEYGKENEVILPHGNYHIQISTKLLPFVSSINKDNYKAEFLGIDTLSDKTHETRHQSRKFEHIMFHYKQFDEEMSAHLFKLLIKDLKINYIVDVRQAHDWDHEDGIPEIRVDWNIPHTFFMYRNLLLDEDAKLIEEQIIEVLKKIDHEFMQKTKGFDFTKKFKLNVDDTLVLVAKMAHYTDHVHFIKHVNRGIGETYNRLNTRENVRRINQIKDPKEQRKAIDQMTKQMVHALSQLR